MFTALVAMSACSAEPSGIARTTAPTGAPSAMASVTPHVTPMPDAEASDVVVNLVADAARWDVDTMTAPAEMTWTLVLDNRDRPNHPHNFTIRDGPGVAGRIYQSPQSVGPATERWEIPGLPAGTYEFVCTLHDATMVGTLVVE